MGTTQKRFTLLSYRVLTWEQVKL
uniref:Uncharacterized protein n=1 Tax=Rhizophora mucronata TaxID=61149 RepID=A0A2P2JNA3_RHIMU